MPEQPDLIRPKAVPLSHAGPKPASRRAGPPKLAIFAFLAAAAGLIAALFTLAPRWVTPVAIAPEAPAEASRQAPSPRTAPPDGEPPPFQALRREQARREAQDELARFVEMELQLRESMQVQGWGAADYAAAKDLAQQGDDAFVAERYAEAIDGYRAAGDALAALVEQGRSRFGEALAKGIEAIDGRDPSAAQTWLEQASAIQPENPDLAQAQARAARLPEIIELLRAALNHELAGRWEDALDAYRRIRALDAQTPGLDEAAAAAREGRARQRLQSFLSEGFAALSGGAFDEAEAAFRQALAISPGNDAALGGLQQLASQRLLAQVAQLRRQAERQAEQEDWAAASDSYRAILALDGNIQFARSGLRGAEAQAEAQSALDRVAAAPEALSSDRRYADALATLEQAKALQPQGPNLARAIGEVEALLQAYAKPVPVLLQSDNATEVLLSQVGPLGKFSEKRLNLRPGAYILIGSRDGCRDVRARITVRAEMDPVDIRCQEVLQQ